MAVAPPRLLLGAPPPTHAEASKHFNEILEFPVSADTVRGLATRYLLQPREIVAVAATLGMAEGGIEPAPWMTRHAGGSGTTTTTTTTLVSSAPSGVEGRGGGGGGGTGGALQEQQQQQQQKGGSVGREEVLSGAPVGPLSGAGAEVLGNSPYTRRYAAEEMTR